MEVQPEPQRSQRARFPFWKVLFAIYAAALVASWIVMLKPAEEPLSPRPGFAFLETPAYGPDGNPVPGDPVRLAYRDSGPRSGPVVLALQGSPGSGDDFRSLRPLLKDRLRIIAPDMPGFGQSSRHIPNYSVRAHASYCLELLDHLGIDQIHLLGCLLYTSPSPRDQRGSRMPSSA